MLCASVRDESTRHLPCWFLLNAVLAANRLKRSRDIDAAVAYAAKRGWLEVAGKPVHSLTITAAGVAMLKALDGRKRQG